MTSRLVWMSSGQELTWGMNVLWQVTLITSLSLVAARCLQRMPAVRHGILCGSLVLVLLTPVFSLVVCQSGYALFSISLFDDLRQQASDETFLADPEPEALLPTRLEPKTVSDSSESLEAASLRMDKADLERSNAVANALVRGRADQLHRSSTRSGTASNQPDLLVHGDVSSARRVGSAVVTVWLCGAAFMLLRMLIRWCRATRLLKTARGIASEQIEQVFSEACQQLQISRRPVLIASPAVNSPVAVGIWRHQIVLPTAMMAGWNRDQLSQILIHELAHVARHDPLVGLLQCVAAAIFWIHPLVHLLNRQLAKTREEICDNHVLAGTTAANYCRTLLMVAESIAETRSIAGTVGLLTSRWKLESRIAGLLDHRRVVITRITKRGHFIVGILLMFTLLIAAGGTISLNPIDARGAAADPPDKILTDAAEQKPKHSDAEEDEQSIIGTVVSEDGKPVTRLSVDLTRQDGRGALTVQTDEQGRFATPLKCWKEPVYGGELFVAVANDQSARLGWFQIPSMGVKRMTSDGTVLPKPEPKPFTIKLLPLDRVVTGQIVGPDREPLENVRVQAIRLRSATNGDVDLYGFEMRAKLPLPSAMTDASGRFRILLPKDVTVVLNALHPNWIVKNIPVVNDDLGEIALKASAKMDGKLVFGDSGKPVVGILVHAHCFNAIRSRQLRQNRGKPDSEADLGMGGFCVTDAEGRYEIGGLREDPHDIQIDTRTLGREFVAPYGEVDVAAGETKTVDVVISKGRRISGRIIDVESGEPIPGVDVFSNITRQEEPRWAFGNGFHPTNEQGEFEFFALPGHAALNANVNPDNWKTIPESKTEFDIAPDQDPEPVELKLRRAQTGQLRPRAIHTLNVGENSIISFAFAPDSKTIITGGARYDESIENDQERRKARRTDIRVWDVASGQDIARFGDQPGGIDDLALSTDGKTLVAAVRLPDESGLIRIWNVETREPRLTLTGHKNAVLSVDISSDGRFVASGSSDRTARIWDAATGQEIFVLRHTWFPAKLRFSPDGKLLATSGAKGGVTFWDVETGIERAKFDATNCAIDGLCWSPTGRHLAIACTPYLDDGNTISSQTPGSVRLWDVANDASGTFVRERKVWNGEHHPSDITFSANGKFVADARHVATVWRVPTGKEVAIIRQSTSSGGGRIRFSPNGKILALGSGRAITLWDVSALQAAEKSN